MDPHTVLNENISNALLGYIDDRAREIWEMFDWQDLKVYEQRAYADYVSSTKVYAAGDVVYDPCQDIYFQSNFGGAGSPEEFPGLWTKLAIGSTSTSQPFLDPVAQGQPTTIPAYVPFSQTGKGTIDTVFGVFATDPRISDWPIPVTYSVSSRGVELKCTSRTTVWVVYREPFPGIGIEVFDPTVTYNTGDAIYDTGDTWISQVNGNLNNEPTTDSGANWQAFKIPYVHRDYIIQTAYGDALLEDGQNDKAEAQWTVAATKAVAQFEKQNTQQGLTTFYDVMTVGRNV